MLFEQNFVYWNDVSNFWEMCPKKSQNSLNCNFITSCLLENFPSLPIPGKIFRLIPGKILFFFPKQPFLELTPLVWTSISWAWLQCTLQTQEVETVLKQVSATGKEGRQDKWACLLQANCCDWSDWPGPYIAGCRGGGVGGDRCPHQEIKMFLSNVMFDFAGLFLVAMLVQNLYTGDPCEGVWSLPPQTKNPRYGPAGHM